MRLHRLRLINYRGVTECDVSFSTNGVTIVEGPNEIGKTSLPEALQLAIDLPDSSHTLGSSLLSPSAGTKAPKSRWFSPPAITSSPTVSGGYGNRRQTLR